MSEKPDYTAMDGPTMLDACGDDAAKWAAAFCQIAAKQGHKLGDVVDPEGWMTGWFANAIEHSSAVRSRKSRTRSEFAPAPPSAQPEPFCLKPQDFLAVRVIEMWISYARGAGVPLAKLRRARDHMDAIEDWQRENPDQVKVPD